MFRKTIAEPKCTPKAQVLARAQKKIWAINEDVLNAKGLTARTTYKQLVRGEA